MESKTSEKITKISLWYGILLSDVKSTNKSVVCRAPKGPMLGLTLFQLCIIDLEYISKHLDHLQMTPILFCPHKKLKDVNEDLKNI